MVEGQKISKPELIYAVITLIILFSCKQLFISNRLITILIVLFSFISSSYLLYSFKKLIKVSNRIDNSRLYGYIMIISLIIAGISSKVQWEYIALISLTFLLISLICFFPYIYLFSRGFFESIKLNLTPQSKPDIILNSSVNEMKVNYFRLLSIKYPLSFKGAYFLTSFYIFSTLVALIFNYLGPKNFDFSYSFIYEFISFPGLIFMNITKIFLAFVKLLIYPLGEKLFNSSTFFSTFLILNNILAYVFLGILIGWLYEIIKNRKIEENKK